MLVVLFFQFISPHAIWYILTLSNEDKNTVNCQKNQK